MREKGILFSTPMVQAILDDRKTQTRRVIKPQPKGNICIGICINSTIATSVGKFAFTDDYDNPTFREEVKPPFLTGDLLWVREAWCEYAGRYLYAATIDEDTGGLYYGDFKWRPSIHMPKAAARIWLRVVDVRAERLQGITLEDILSEGIRDAEFKYGDPWTQFIDVWDSINAKRGYGWEKNPWVWVVTFERVGR